MDTWRSYIFFSVGEVATSKWTHGEVGVFGSTVYKIFALFFSMGNENMKIITILKNIKISRDRSNFKMGHENNYIVIFFVYMCCLWLRFIKRINK